LVSDLEHLLTLLEDGWSSAIMDLGGGQQAQSAVMRFVIVPEKEIRSPGERALIAQVPTQGVWTLYPIIGDLFGWLSVVGVVALVIMGIIQSLRSRKVKAARQESQTQVGQPI
jgi:hypothetical protein